MKNPKSVISFARRGLKLKGASVHSGRGYVDMFHDCPNRDVLADRLLEAQKKWIGAGLIDKAVQRGECWELTFINIGPEAHHNYYRTLVYNVLTNRLSVVM